MQPRGHLALIRAREVAHQPVGDQQAQHPVAQELQPLVVGERSAARVTFGPLPDAGVRQGQVQQRRIPEVVAEAAPQRLNCLGPSVSHQSRTVKNRLGWIFENQLTGFHSEAPGFHENRMISALPIRFSAGT